MRVEIRGEKIKGWLTTEEAAWVLGVSKAKVRSMIVKGELKNKPGNPDYFVLYGRYFVRGTVIDRIHKKMEKEAKTKK